MEIKTHILAVIGLLLVIPAAYAQKEIPATYLTDRLPIHPAPDTSATRSYRMVTDYKDYDLTGRFLAKRRLTGTVTYEAGDARWKDVYYAESKVSAEDFPPGKMINYMQEFRYRPGAGILAADFFQKQLPEADPLVMNMIWDALAFEILTSACWDSLRLNKEYRARNIDSKLDIAVGAFENKETQITWLGITEISGKICAILKYAVMNNPLEVEFGEVSMRGRSHYWGEIYVSLPDRQIERADLTEDILTDMKMKGTEKNTIGYTTRNISLQRVE